MWPALLTPLIGEDTTGMTLSLDNGNEIAVQQILHATAQAVVVRGRWAGSCETGWTFLIPWEQIVCCVFTRSLPASLQKQLGLSSPDPQADSRHDNSPAVESSPPAPTLSAEGSTAASASVPPPAPSEERLRQLRERLRQRSQL